MRGAEETIENGFNILQKVSSIDNEMKKRIIGDLFNVSSQIKLLEYEYNPDESILKEAVDDSNKAGKEFKRIDSGYGERDYLIGFCWWNKVRIYRLYNISESDDLMKELDETFGEKGYSFMYWMENDRTEILREEAGFDQFKLQECKNVAKNSLKEYKK